MFVVKLIKPENWKFYFFIALLVKGLMLFYFTNVFGSSHPEKMLNHLVLLHNDYSYHLKPVDNYFDTGKFYFTPGMEFSGRMPGYSLPYFILRLLFSQSSAVTLLILLQFVFSSLSVYLLALTSLNIFKKEKIFLLVYFIFLFSTFTSVFDFQTISESFSVSCIITFLYFIVSYSEKGNSRRVFYLLLSGLFLTWAIFLRPYMGLFLPLATIFVLYIERKNHLVSWNKAVIAVFVFLCPFILSESAWTARNYFLTGQFIPLEASLDQSYGKLYSKGWLDTRKLIAAWGGEAAYFEPGSEAWWFRKSTDQEAKQYSFKDRCFSNVTSYNIDSLKELRILYREFMEEKDPERAMLLDMQISAVALQYRSDFINNNPYVYYVLKPLISIRKLIFSSGSSYLPLPSYSQMTFFQKFIKLFYSGLYYLVLFFGTAGIILCLFHSACPKEYAMLPAGLVVFLIATIVFYSDIQEPRYFIAAYPILVLFTSLCLSRFNDRFERKKI